jgi:dolichol-phosphate mannosyltransferase
MDADLSHPPEKIPEMLAVFEKSGADVVIGSRYVEGGSSDKLYPFSRKFFSRATALMARVLLAVSAKDPLSGFLVFRKEKFFSGIQLKPIGWKLGLEFMVKCHCKNIREVPIHFSDRTQGVSKVSFKVGMDYIRHLVRLMLFKVFSRQSI